MEQGSCLEALGKGMVLAIVTVVLPWIIVSRYWYEINDIVDGISRMPVVRKMSSDFRTGSEAAGQVFAQKLVAFYKGGVAPAPAARRKGAYTWDRAAVEARLAERFSAGKRRSMKAFLDYIEQYRPLAEAEMLRAKIPASVTLAQGILETDAGRSRLATIANNHFGIKCIKKSDYRADGVIDDNDFYPHSIAHGCLQQSDDHHYDRFQMYHSAEDSYRHHSMLLAGKRYSWIGQYQVGSIYQIPKKIYGKDVVPYYAAWCVGLKMSGYATSRRYAEKLTLIIETYQLWKIDYDIINQ